MNRWIHISLQILLVQYLLPLYIQYLYIVNLSVVLMLPSIARLSFTPLYSSNNFRIREYIICTVYTAIYPNQDGIQLVECHNRRHTPE